MGSRDPIPYREECMRAWRAGRWNLNAEEFLPGPRLTEHSKVDDNVLRYNSPQVSTQFPCNDLTGKVAAVEQDQMSLRDDVRDLQVALKNISNEVDVLKRGGWSVEVGPFKPNSEDALRQEFEAIRDHVCRVYSDTPVIDKVDGSGDNAINKPTVVTGPGTVSPAASVKSVPPHLRKLQKNGASPPQLNGNKETKENGTKDIGNVTNGTIVTEKVVETRSSTGQVNVSHRVLTPPLAFNDATKSDSDQSSNGTTKPNPVQDSTTLIHGQASGSAPIWTPLAVTQFDPLPTSMLDTVPSPDHTVTFHPDFLRNFFGGTTWSYGLQYIIPTPGSGPPSLKNRTYYTLDAAYEPFLPTAPGLHGAKLTAFFNINPEEKYGIEGESSFENVPLFIANKDARTAKMRYTYYGDYSQTRWSDKLDYENITTHVPSHVKHWWAEELSASGRPKWVTEAMKRHFFPKPEYEGYLVGLDNDDDGRQTETTDATEIQVARMEKDLKRYAKTLAQWDKQASLHSSFTSKENILAAFERADADDPPALRLWLEYLQCVGYNREFYQMLEVMQKRNESYL